MWELGLGLGVWPGQYQATQGIWFAGTETMAVGSQPPRSRQTRSGSGLSA